MADPAVLYGVKDRIATVTLNRPDRLNAFNGEMETGLRQAMEIAARDEAVRVIVLTGAGRGFCAGADMERLSGAAGSGGSTIPREVPKPLDLGHSARADFQHRYSYFPAIPKPVIGAINGPAAGLGFVFACYCDMRFAGSEAGPARLRLPCRLQVRESTRPPAGTGWDNNKPSRGGSR